jgi:Lar family restriction alleviation protein
MSITLKSCPFCGSVELDYGTYTGTLAGTDYICCEDCGAEMTMHVGNKTSLDVVKRWNRRCNNDKTRKFML